MESDLAEAFSGKTRTVLQEILKRKLGLPDQASSRTEKVVTASIMK